MQSSDLHTAAASPAIILQPVDGLVAHLPALRRTATERPPQLLSRRDSRKQRRQRSCSAQHIEMMTPEEFEALPLSIQRKYFSPKERMHIAQQAAVQMRKRQSMKSSWLAPPTPTTPMRPSKSAENMSISSPSVLNRSGVSLLQAGQNDITENEARWFLTLPNKFRKQHFGREEQLVLMRRCKKVLEHVAPELVSDVYSRLLNVSDDEYGSSLTKTRPSTASGSRHEESKSYLSFDTSSDPATHNADWEMEVVTRYSPTGPPSPEIEPAPAFTPMVTVDNTILSSNNPRPFAHQTSSTINKSPHKAFIRTRSLTPLPLPPPTLAPPVPPVPRLPNMDLAHHFALSAQRVRPFMDQTSTLLEPPTERKYYQDNDARVKLRNALASKDKFDEVLAFGFSPTIERNNSTSTGSSFPLQQPALYHSEREDDGASIETASPSTPTYDSGKHPAIKQSSCDSSVAVPFGQNVLPNTSGSIRSREMTIHMTLTRRDLLNPSPEEQIYSVQRLQTTGVDVAKADPLALEPLTVSEDSTGAHGAFAIHDSVLPKGLKKAWRSLTRH